MEVLEGLSDDLDDPDDRLDDHLDDRLVVVGVSVVHLLQKKKNEQGN